VRWLRLFVFLVRSSTHKYLFFTEFLSAAIADAVGTPKKQCAVIALAAKNCMRGGERKGKKDRGK